MATSSNLVVGSPSSVKIAAYGVAEGSAVDVGALDGGLKLNYTPDFYFKKADAWLGPVGAVKTDEKMTIEMTLAEVSLANLAYAFGYPTTAVSSSTLTIGGDATATELTVYINGNAPDGGTVKITVHKCVIIGATELSMVKKDKSMVKVTMEVLQDTAQTANQQMVSVVYSGTDTTPPTVAMTTPAEDGTVTKNAKGTVTLTFTEGDNAIDEGTLIYANADNATVMIMDITDATATALVAGSFTYDAGTKVLTFTPTSNWTDSHKHQVIITTGVRDTAGNHLANIFLGHFTVA